MYCYFQTAFIALVTYSSGRPDMKICGRPKVYHCMELDESLHSYATNNIASHNLSFL